MDDTSTTVAAPEDRRSMTTSSHSPAWPSYVLRRVGRGARRISRCLGLRLQLRLTWGRALAGVVGLGYLVVAFFVLGLDVPSGFHGWLPTAFGFAPCLLLLTLGLGIGRGPVGWTLAEDGVWTGNTWGLWSDWPEVTYSYVTGDPAQVATEEYGALLEAKGWVRNSTGYRVDPSPGLVSQAWEKGRWNVQIRIAGPGSGPGQFGTAEYAALTTVDLYFDGQR